VTLETAPKAAGKWAPAEAGKRDTMVATCSGVTHKAKVGSDTHAREGKDRL
jgi:hypothetical protein